MASTSSGLPAANFSVERGAVAVDRREHGLDQPAQGAVGVEGLALGLGLGDRHVGRAAELSQLEHGDPQQLAQAGAQALGLVGEGVDHGVEASPMAEHPVDEQGHQATVAAGQVGAPGQQVVGQHAVGEPLALVELPQDLDGEAAGGRCLHGRFISTVALRRTPLIRCRRCAPPGSCSPPWSSPLRATTRVPGGDPEAAPDALLREVQKLDYRGWTRPPKHEMRVATNAPHGRGVEVFVDEAMAAALENADGLGRTQWPEGGTIVLEGYAAATLAEDAAPDEPTQIAIMRKRGGTWRWEQYEAEDLSQPRFAGRPDVCVGCHLGTQDFVRGFSLPKPVVD
jgi:hypothetical protein